jgi:riboflavin-specific deaminase-like protein
MDGIIDPDGPAWAALLAARDAADGGRPAPLPPGRLGALFGPVLAPPAAPDGCLLVGRLAQTLDGRIATVTGSSQWIGGPGDILHTHRLRALCHAVIVGAGTIRSDDPRLTTRAAPGPDPVRVVLDTDRRLGPDHRVFRDPGPPTLLLCAADAPGPPTHGRAAVLRVKRAADGAGLDIAAAIAALAARGLRRLFVEGGGVTVSRFLAAGALDRLHVTVAPVLLGSGIPAFSLPPCERIADGLRFDWTAWPIPPDMLFDIALHRARPGGGA